MAAEFLNTIVAGNFIVAALLLGGTCLRRTPTPLPAAVPSEAP